jgi:hypothetical protein
MEGKFLFFVGVLKTYISGFILGAMGGKGEWIYISTLAG